MHVARKQRPTSRAGKKEHHSGLSRPNQPSGEGQERGFNQGRLIRTFLIHTRND